MKIDRLRYVQFSLRINLKMAAVRYHKYLSCNRDIFVQKHVHVKQKKVKVILQCDFRHLLIISIKDNVLLSRL